MLDVDVLIGRIKDGGLLLACEITWVCSRVKDILIDESNVKVVQAPVTIVGDIHGQFWDLMELFRVGGWVPDTNYLFLGDYVDRGYFSIETISLLLLLKLRYPSRITLLRGNHESRSTSMVYGFYTECLQKYRDVKVWAAVMEVFDFLSISALVEGMLFAVHGGLSPSILELDQIRIINRFQEVPRDGPFADVMWSDPDGASDGFSVSVRGAGFTFGLDVVKRFLHVNKLTTVARAHQLCSEGYQILFGGRCVTVWSAPNYCYRCRNKAAILEVDTNLIEGGLPAPRHFNVFSEAPESMRKAPAFIYAKEEEGSGGADQYFT